MYLHTVPIHLETEETFLLNFTGRQCLLLGCGVSIGSILVGQVPHLGWGLLLGGLVLSAMVMLALTRIAGRYLEEWATVWLLYQIQPRRFLWTFVPPDDTTLDEQTTSTQEWEDQNTW